MFINAEIYVDEHLDALLVPKRAVSYDAGAAYVYLVTDGVANRYELKRGYSSQNVIEVLDLIDSDGNPADLKRAKLVLTGHNNLKNGDVVEAVEKN